MNILFSVLVSQKSAPMMKFHSQVMCLHVCYLLNLLVMRQVTRSTFNHSTGSVQVNPQEEPDIWTLQVVVYVFTSNNIEKFVYAEDSLANRFDEPVFTLKTWTTMFKTYCWLCYRASRARTVRLSEGKSTYSVLCNIGYYNEIVLLHFMTLLVL